MTPEEFHKLVRTELIPMMAAWPPEELESLLAQVPKWQREGWARLIEEHNRQQTEPTGD